MADTTVRYDWPYQEPSDPPDGPALGKDLAEAIEATVGTIDDRITALIASHLTPVTVAGATAGTAATGFTVNNATIRTLAAGKHVYVKLDIRTTNAITAGGGDIPDTVIFNVAAPYRPAEITSTIFSATPGTGEVQMNGNGDVILRTADVTISAGRDLRMVFEYIRP